MISIIIPVYNVAPYIEECIRSVIAQTYTGQMECIIVDDCGTDDSIIICERLIAEYDGTIEFKIVHHTKNRGVASARNTGINVAKGDYVYFLDADDTITPQCLQLLTDCLRLHPQVDLVQAGAYCLSEEYKWMDIQQKELPEYSEDKEWIKSTMLDRLTLNPAPWNKLVKRQLLIDHQIFFIDVVAHEDDHWNFFLAKHVCSLAVCRHNTYNYRIRENSLIRSSQEKNILAWLTVIGDFAVNIDEPCREKQISFVFSNLHQYYVYGTKLCRHAAAKHLLRLCKHLPWKGKILIIILLLLPGRINVMSSVYMFFEGKNLLN